MTKLDALVEILNRYAVRTESGKRVTTFVNKGDSAYEMILLSKQDLQQVMSAAYDAGKTSK